MENPVRRYLPAEKCRESLNPFQLNVDPMKRLLLLNFANDPDGIYLGFEPQLFDDKVNGKGLLIIAWRHDGKVDVYHEPSLSPDPDKYDIAGKGLNQLQQTQLAPSVFRIEEKGVNVEVGFRDIQGRSILITLHENHPKRRAPFGLLAPMGMAAEQPSSMPLIWLHDFYFVRRKHTAYNVQIDGKSHLLDKLPLPIDGTWMYFARYSSLPFILTLNPNFKGILTKKEDQLQRVLWKAHGNFKEIERITVCQDSICYNMIFYPPFPDFVNLLPQQEILGKFEISGHPSCGKISGNYHIKTDTEAGEIQLDPCGGWQPKESKWMVRLIYALQKDFKRWPKTYRWKAKWRLSQEVCAIESSWERTKY